MGKDLWVLHKALLSSVCDERIRQVAILPSLILVCIGSITHHLQYVEWKKYSLSTRTPTWVMAGKHDIRDLQRKNIKSHLSQSERGIIRAEGVHLSRISRHISPTYIIGSLYPEALWIMYLTALTQWVTHCALTSEARRLYLEPRRSCLAISNQLSSNLLNWIRRSQNCSIIFYLGNFSPHNLVPIDSHNRQLIPDIISSTLWIQRILCNLACLTRKLARIISAPSWYSHARIGIIIWIKEKEIKKTPEKRVLWSTSKTSRYASPQDIKLDQVMSRWDINMIVLWGNESGFQVIL